MPNRPEKPDPQNWDEYRLYVMSTLEALNDEVWKLHDKVLSLEIRAGIIGAVVGTIMGSAASFVVGLLKH